MKKVSKKMVLTALLTLAALAPADMGAFSFASLATLKNTTSSYLMPLYNYTSTFFSHAWNWGTQKTVNLVAHTPFIGGTELPRKILWCADHPKIAASIFCNKMLNYRAKKQNKKILLGGALAPEKVVTVINSMLNELRSSDKTQSKSTIVCEPFSLTGTITKTDTNTFQFQASLCNGRVEIGAATLYIKFEKINENGKSYERTTLTEDGVFSVIPQYRQRGFGSYLFCILLHLLKSQKNALGIVYPCPHKLQVGQSEDDLLPVLTNYYKKKFGLITHPCDKNLLVISFKNGKIDPSMELFKAIEKNDLTTIEKLLNSGLSVDLNLAGITAGKFALEHALRNNNIALFNLLITKYNALKNRDHAFGLLEIALEQSKNFTIAGLILEKHPTLIDMRDQNGRTFLCNAINSYEPDWEKVAFLLGHSANPLLEIEGDDSPAHLVETRNPPPAHIQDLFQKAQNTHGITQKITATSNPHFKLQATNNALNVTDQKASKIFFGAGELAPDKVVPKMNEAITLMRKNNVGIDTRNRLTFTEGPITLEITIEKRPSDSVNINMEILRKNARLEHKSIGYRWFPIKFKLFEGKNGEHNEYVIAAPGNFYIEPEDRRNGVGRELFSLQNSLLKSHKYACGKVYPCPEHSSWLKKLVKYYKSFGFVTHPMDSERLIILFKDGKIDPDMHVFIDFCKAIRKNDIVTVQKLLKSNINLAIPVDETSAATIALALAIDAGKFDIAELITEKYPASVNTPILRNPFFSPQPLLLYYFDMMRTTRWDQIEFLLTHNANPLAKSENGECAADLMAICPPHIQKLLAEAIKKHQITDKIKE